MLQFSTVMVSLDGVGKHAKFDLIQYFLRITLHVPTYVPRLGSAQIKAACRLPYTIWCVALHDLLILIHLAVDTVAEAVRQLRQ